MYSQPGSALTSSRLSIRTKRQPRRSNFLRWRQRVPRKSRISARLLSKQSWRNDWRKSSFQHRSLKP